jgi:hypothetical protein
MKPIVDPVLPHAYVPSRAWIMGDCAVCGYSQNDRIHNMPAFDPVQARSIADGYCPDCRHRGFVLGPRGGASQNIECGNLACRARFNITPAFMDSSGMFAFCHRIEKESEGGSDWGKPLEQRDGATG